METNFNEEKSPMEQKSWMEKEKLFDIFYTYNYYIDSNFLRTFKQKNINRE